VGPFDFVQGGLPALLSSGVSIALTGTGSGIRAMLRKTLAFRRYLTKD
jgi:hypothetical protein